MKKQLFLGLLLLGSAAGLDAKILETKEISNNQAVADWKKNDTKKAKDTCYMTCNLARSNKNIKGVRANQENSMVAMQGGKLMCTCTDGQ